MIPMYSRFEGGVSAPRDWNPTPASAKPAALIELLLAARQFAFDKFCTAVCEVVVSDAATVVSVAAIASGVKGSKLTDNTTKTSRSSGERLRSTLVCVNVFGPDSSTENPIGTMLELCFRPAGIYWGVPR